MPEVELYVEDSGGPGRPVVLIHGWPLSAESWQAQVPALTAAGYRVVAYDRRGFGRSEQPESGYDYDTLAADVDRLITARDLRDVTLVGFSMGGGEVARYVSNHGEGRLRSVVFASAVPPCLMNSADNPDGPLSMEAYQSLQESAIADRDGFFDTFTTNFYTVDGDLKVPAAFRERAIQVCQMSSQAAVLGCMESWATDDFRADLAKLTVPALVIHGDSDVIVPFEGSGQRTHDMVPGSRLVVVEGGPHGINSTHVAEFNAALLDFLEV